MEGTITPHSESCRMLAEISIADTFHKFSGYKFSVVCIGML